MSMISLCVCFVIRTCLQYNMLWESGEKTILYWILSQSAEEKYHWTKQSPFPQISWLLKMNKWKHYTGSFSSVLWLILIASPISLHWDNYPSIHSSIHPSTHPSIIPANILSFPRSKYSCQEHLEWFSVSKKSLHSLIGCLTHQLLGSSPKSSFKKCGQRETEKKSGNLLWMGLL